MSCDRPNYATFVGAVCSWFEYEHEVSPREPFGGAHGSPGRRDFDCPGRSDRQHDSQLVDEVSLAVHDRGQRCGPIAQGHKVEARLVPGAPGSRYEERPALLEDPKVIGVDPEQSAR
jgi:hypothetical protein